VEVSAPCAGQPEGYRKADWAYKHSSAEAVEPGRGMAAAVRGSNWDGGCGCANWDARDGQAVVKGHAGEKLHRWAWEERRKE
jgi:hypothetical protein